MRTFVGDDEFVQPKRNETAPRSECRPTLKNALTQPRLLEMDEKSALRQLCRGKLVGPSRRFSKLLSFQSSTFRVNDPAIAKPSVCRGQPRQGFSLPDSPERYGALKSFVGRKTDRRSGYV